MEDYRTSTSYKRLETTFENIIESSEAKINSISVFRFEQFPTRRSINIPVSVQERVIGRKQSGVGTSDKPLDRENELLYQSEEALGPRKYRGPSEGLDFNSLQRESPTDKSLVEEPKHVVRGSEEEVGPKKKNSPLEAPKASKRKNPPQQAANKEKKAPKRSQKGKQKEKE
ncbi:hypothetical protein O181_065362 [Austropuccinia psidii MF-1]|uniref:Uncharacterized protein n=1 Tax=Austropuccinia psidii MF-1 TaxID=1389203 RepID=A0A9Q3EXA7_9BASI|nr:hypothetical protein [Austropuccinia psidii MF-1]